MQVTKIYTPDDTIAVPRLINPKHVASLFINNFDAKPYERILIVTDPAMEHQEAAVWFTAAKQVSQHAQMVVFEGMTQNAQEPPSIVGLMMVKSDIIILQTSFSLSHTNTRRIASGKKAKIASLPGVDLKILKKTANSDYQNLASLTNHLAELLSQGQQATITSPAGTHLTIDITNRSGIADTGILTAPGSFGNLPAGEAFVAPVETSTHGLLVIDGSFAGITIDEPITLTIDNGIVSQISGGQAARELITQLQKVPQIAKTIGEFGIGTNKRANPTGKIIEAEKAYGTVHFALGKNDGFGGSINVPFHSDGVVLNPTLTIDNKFIITEGSFV